MIQVIVEFEVNGKKSSAKTHVRTVEDAKMEIIEANPGAQIISAYVTPKNREDFKKKPWSWND